MNINCSESKVYSLDGNGKVNCTLDTNVLTFMYKNISMLIKDIGVKTKEANLYFNDKSNAYIYILFVLLFFAISFTGLMFNFFKKEKGTKELEILYKDFVERDNVPKQLHAIQERSLSSCQDFINSTYSMALIGINQDDTAAAKYSRSPQNLTDEESPLYHSSSSVSNTGSFLSLTSRKPSFARSTNTLLERFGSIYETFEESESGFENKSGPALLNALETQDSCKPPRFKYHNEKESTQSTYSLGSIKSGGEKDTISLSMLAEGSIGTNTNTFLSLLPPMERKPSITFSDTVAIFRTGRRGSSPCSSQASENETSDVCDPNPVQQSLSEERLPFLPGFSSEDINGFKKKSLSLSSIYNKSSIEKALEHTLHEDENKLNLELPKIKRRQSIDVSKIEQLLNISDGEGQNNLPLPTITFSQYNSNVGLNQSVSNLNQI